MYTKWTQHLKTDEEKKRFEEAIMNSKNVLVRLDQIIEEIEETLDRSETNPKVFDSPNWAYLQAFKNGCRAGYDTIRKLIDLDQQKEPNERPKPIFPVRPD